MKRLTVEDIKIEKPDFKNQKMPKGEMITKWLIKWVEHSLETGVANFGDFIPSKYELAEFLEVSTATVQNSIREVRDLGYFSSKQSKGTIITDYYSKDLKEENKLTEGTLTECKIKKIILDEGFKLNSPIFSISELAKRTDISQNTIRFTLNHLTKKGFLEKKHLRGNKYIWLYKKEFELTKDEIINGIKDENYTLMHRLCGKIRNYIEKTYKHGEKILPNSAFATMFDVSIKTINDAMKILNSKKIILSRRGQYGTIYLGYKQDSKTEFISTERRKINSENKYIYSWQKTLSHLKKYIIENYKAGDKIAPIRELASILNVSPNTIRRALKDMFEAGYIITKRGKSGGIFITELPESDEAYRWLALNPDAINFKN